MSKAKQLTSLKQAAEYFTKQPYEQSALRQVMINLIQNPEATKRLVREMELLSKELG